MGKGAKLSAAPGTASPTGPKPPSKHYDVPLSQFLPIARFLVEKGISVPRQWLDIGRSCIELRARAAVMLGGQRERRRGGHEHFLGVLKEIIKLLEPCANPQLSGNSFAALQDLMLEEEPEIALSSVDGAHDTYGIAMDREEAINRAMVFFGDIKAIREHLDSVWRDYLARKVDLITASVMTDTAIEILQKTHDEFAFQILPHFDGIQDLMDALLDELEAKTGQGIALPSGHSITPWEHVDAVMLMPFQHLDQLLTAFDSESAPVANPGFFGQYDPTARRNANENMIQDRILITETMVEYILPSLVGRHRTRGRTDAPNSAKLLFDQFGIHIDAYARTRKVTLMTVISAQIFVDINRVLGRQAERGRQDMTLGLRHMYRSLVERERDEPAPPWEGTWPLANEM